MDCQLDQPWTQAGAAAPLRMSIYRSSIPMRGFEHAAARRDVAEAILVRVEFAGGGEGWGETLPRPYVTGETMESVADDLERLVFPAMVAGEALPQRTTGGRCINAALCAAELAYMSAGNADCGLRIADCGLPRPGSRRASRPVSVGARQCGQMTPEPGPIRVTGVLGSANPARTLKRLMLMRLFGLRDFKLKLGFGDDIDRENLRLVHRRIARAVAAGRCSLRVDVNGGWDAASTPSRVAELVQYGVCVVEQPVFCPMAELVDLAGRCKLPLMADESLLTIEDGKVGTPPHFRNCSDSRGLDDSCVIPTSASLPATSGNEEASPLSPRIWWNIRISKNGGIGPCRRLAAMAAGAGIPFTVGAMVGESGILSAAQRFLLSGIPGPRFVEGNYGRFLLADDITRPSPRFGYGGRLRPLGGRGLGVRVDPRKLAKYARLLKVVEP